MIEFRLPSLGSDMDAGTLVEWRVKPDDTVARGQVVAVVDTAKAAIDVECWQEGTVHALRVEPGTVMAVGTVMAILREAGETAAEVEGILAARATAVPVATQPHGAGPTSPVASAPDAVVPVPMPAPAPAPAPVAVGEGTRVRISPLARRRAHELGLDPARIAGHGDQGAVRLVDVEAAQAGRPVAATVATATSRAQEIRRVIAAAMSRSKREIPHYYLAEEIAFARAAAWLADANRDRPAAQRLLPAALMLKAVALALQRYPEFNGFWRDGAFVPGAGVHLGVAVSLREGGLVAPALHDVPALGLAALTKALLDLVKRARAGALRSSELSEATITVTNLGDQGVDSVFGVIYPPQVALLGFGRVRMRPWASDTGGVQALPVVTATLAADHRSSDGHRGALLLVEIRELLQDPQVLDLHEENR